MSSSRKRLVVEPPSAADFPDLGCSDDHALRTVEEVLAWLCEPKSNPRVADRVAYLEQMVYHKLGFDILGSLPSFSDVTWDQLTDMYKLGESYERMTHRHQVPICHLPFTLHRKIKCDGWVKMDVNGDVSVQLKEAGIVNLAQYAIEAVLSIFQGRIVNKAEANLPATPFSSGGRVEFQLYTAGNVLVVVCEFKRQIDGLTNDHAAQLFAEMICKSLSNQIHGMLSNFDYHHFFTYHPATQKISMGPVFTTASKERMERLNKMVVVINYLFSVCLDSFRQFVQVSKQISASRQDRTDTSSANFRKAAEPEQTQDGDDAIADAAMVTSPRPSTILWNSSEDEICRAQECFLATKDMTVASVNERGAKGLMHLQNAYALVFINSPRSTLTVSG
ncbi:hypothetical protein C8R47DRAFT_1119164 [Mycena vitilis]|nr:hypothetical protein C8R47DRAFT_1119164 [Mycena vitilis]